MVSYTNSFFNDNYLAKNKINGHWLLPCTILTFIQMVSIVNYVAIDYISFVYATFVAYLSIFKEIWEHCTGNIVCNTVTLNLCWSCVRV